MKQIIGRQDRRAPFLRWRSSGRGALALPCSLALALLALPGIQTARAAQPPGTLVTVAGNGQPGFSGDGGPATQARVQYPLGIGVDAVGDLFIACGDRVRRVAPDGVIKTVAGSGKGGFSGDGGPATSAGIAALGVATDSAGNLYIADFQLRPNNRIRKVDTSGTITTVAGGGNPTDGLGDGGPAINAQLGAPFSIAVDANGNLFIADSGNNRVRKVDTSGTISTVAGIGGPNASSGDGGAATAAQVDPYDVILDGAGRLYIADADNHRVRKVELDGTISTVAGGGNPADGVGDGGLATQAHLDTPAQLALDGAGNLFIADTRGRRIRRVDSAGIITTVVGTGQSGFSPDGTPAAQARLVGPYGLAIDPAGNLYFSEVDSVTVNTGGVFFSQTDRGRIRAVMGVAAPTAAPGG